MSGIILLILAIPIAVVHGGITYVNRLLGAGVGHTLAECVAAVRTRIATVAGVLGWGVPALGLALEMRGVPALSVLPPAIVGPIPLALACLLVSLWLRFVARSGGIGHAVRRAYRCTSRFTKAVIPLLGAVLLALAVPVARWIAKGILESTDVPRPGGSYYNRRTCMHDDGLDPYGMYEDKP